MTLRLGSACASRPATTLPAGPPLQTRVRKTSSEIPCMASSPANNDINFLWMNHSDQVSKRATRLETWGGSRGVFIPRRTTNQKRGFVWSTPKDHGVSSEESNDSITVTLWSSVKYESARSRAETVLLECYPCGYHRVQALRATFTWATSSGK